MKKRAYLKPELSIIELRTEERLGACDYTWKVNTAGQNCYSNIFAVSSPSTCIVMTTPQTIS